MVGLANKATVGTSSTAPTVTKKDSIRFLAVMKGVDIAVYTGFFSPAKTSNVQISANLQGYEYMRQRRQRMPLIMGGREVMATTRLLSKITKGAHLAGEVGTYPDTLS